MEIKYRVETLNGAFGGIELIPTKSALMPMHSFFVSCNKIDSGLRADYFRFVKFIDSTPFTKATLKKCLTNDPTFLSETFFRKAVEDSANNFGKPGNYLFEYLKGSSAIAGHGNYVHEFRGFEIERGDKVVIKNGHSYVFILDILTQF